VNKRIESVSSSDRGDASGSVSANSEKVIERAGTGERYSNCRCQEEAPLAPACPLRTAIGSQCCSAC